MKDPVDEKMVGNLVLASTFFDEFQPKWGHGNPNFDEVEGHIPRSTSEVKL